MIKYSENDIPGWNAFLKDCEEQMRRDDDEFGIKSTPVPRAIICPKPDYCFVQMEPGPPPPDKEIKQGYNAFGDWHINYCAYHYLCNCEFKYHVTDLSKGAMSYEDAKKKSTKRYKNWLPWLKEELKLLGYPKTIFAASVKVYDSIKNEFKNVFPITNSSRSNRKLIAKAYNNIPKRDDCIPNEAEWKKFIEDLMEHCKWKPELIKTRSSMISEILNDKWKSKLFAIYKSELENPKKR
ncbi:MAG: hypothetical protein FWF63_07020 [Fibromonadales bacterium]|nr:hypothetical protein [Fibromonadales bacterium]